MFTGAEIVALIVAAISLGTAAVTGFFTYKGQKATAEAKANEEAINGEQAAKKALEEEKKAHEAEQQQRMLEQLNENITKLNSRMDEFTQAMNARMEAAEDSIEKIIGILSKDARTMSSMMRMHRQTESRLQTLMEIESFNMKFSNETSTTLRAIGQIMADALLSPDAAASLTQKLDENSKAQGEFLENIIKAQKSFFDQPITDSDTTIEAELEKIQQIIRGTDTHTVK